MLEIQVETNPTPPLPPPPHVTLRLISIIPMQISYCGINYKGQIVQILITQLDKFLSMYIPKTRYRSRTCPEPQGAHLPHISKIN